MSGSGLKANAVVRSRLFPLPRRNIAKEGFAMVEVALTAFTVWLAAGLAKG
jgi:hypothetical protein